MWRQETWSWEDSWQALFPPPPHNSVPPVVSPSFPTPPHPSHPPRALVNSPSSTTSPRPVTSASKTYVIRWLHSFKLLPPSVQTPLSRLLPDALPTPVSPSLFSHNNQLGLRIHTVSCHVAVRMSPSRMAFLDHHVSEPGRVEIIISYLLTVNFCLAVRM